MIISKYDIGVLVTLIVTIIAVQLGLLITTGFIALVMVIYIALILLTHYIRKIG